MYRQIFRKSLRQWQQFIPVFLLLFVIINLSCITDTKAQTRFSVVELNTENLFDTLHDAGKNDYEFLPQSTHRWTTYRYWEKLNKIGQELIACGQDSTEWALPDIIALCEVENDSVLRDLTKRSVLRKARYEYVMTNSSDERGIDVALLYSPFSFALLHHNSFRIKPIKDMRPTRDILYVSGRIITGDTLHFLVVHAPSRSGGEKFTRKNRLLVAERLCQTIDSIRNSSPSAYIIALGDFNDYSDSPSLGLIYSHDMVNVSANAKGNNGAKGTYRYHGKWGSLDQIIISRNLASKLHHCRVIDDKFLLEPDSKYGGFKPYRFYMGPKYNGGYSDHLPLKLDLKL